MKDYLSKSGQIIGVSILGLMIGANFFAGIISGIWLAFLGNWSVIFYGLFLSFAMPFAYTLVSLPTMAIMPLLIKAVEKKSKFFTVFLGLINVLYSNGIMVAWIYFVFVEFTKNANGIIAIPFILWGYSTVIAPLAYMAKGEAPDNTGTSLGIFLAQSGYVLAIIGWFFGFPYSSILIVLILLAIAFSLFTISIVIKSFDQDQEALLNQGEFYDAVDAEIISNDQDQFVKENNGSESSINFCTSCGKEIAGNPSFCKLCGNKLN
jgi:MFS family permease